MYSYSLPPFGTTCDFNWQTSADSSKNGRVEEEKSSGFCGSQIIVIDKQRSGLKVCRRQSNWRLDTRFHPRCVQGPTFKREKACADFPVHGNVPQRASPSLPALGGLERETCRGIHAYRMRLHAPYHARSSDLMCT